MQTVLDFAKRVGYEQAELEVISDLVTAAGCKDIFENDNEKPWGK